MLGELLLLAVGSPPVPLTDDEHLPVDALRAWVIGAVLCTVVAGANVLMSLRTSPISIQLTVAQLILYTCVWGYIAPPSLSPSC